MRAAHVSMRNPGSAHRIGTLSDRQKERMAKVPCVLYLDPTTAYLPNMLATTISSCCSDQLNPPRKAVVRKLSRALSSGHSTKVTRNWADTVRAMRAVGQALPTFDCPSRACLQRTILRAKIKLYIRKVK
jgi:hypothetical protein